MKDPVVIVLDCGATNIRAIAVNCDGKILSKWSFPNQPSPDPFLKDGLIWDVDDIREKLAKACRLVISNLKDAEILGVCTTGFGVDGAPFDKDNKQLYPVISWACNRTEAIIEDVHKKYPVQDLYEKTGLQAFHFNTVYKLRWLQKHRKDIYTEMDHWLFLPGIISGYLCDSLFTDVSMAGTSMLCDRKTRSFSEEILSAFDLNKKQFPPLAEAGQIAGKVTDAASKQFGIPAGIPVFAAGHDTQFAIFGSGAGINEPVLSSGTWEILMVRIPEVKIGNKTFDTGITTELDAVPGLYNPGIQWLGSRYIEEIKKKHFGEEMLNDDVYDIMIDEAEKARSKRGIIFRNLLHDLSEQTKESLQILEINCGFKAESLIVVGGGSKNSLWNQLRSEALGINIKTIPQTESTVLGAAMFAFTGAGLFNSPDEAREAMLNN